MFRRDSLNGSIGNLLDYSYHYDVDTGGAHYDANDSRIVTVKCFLVFGGSEEQQDR